MPIKQTRENEQRIEKLERTVKGLIAILLDSTINDDDEWLISKNDSDEILKLLKGME